MHVLSVLTHRWAQGVTNTWTGRSASPSPGLPLGRLRRLAPCLVQRQRTAPAASARRGLSRCEWILGLAGLHALVPGKNQCHSLGELLLAEQAIAEH